jgi:hypothetical protein
MGSSLVAQNKQIIKKVLNKRTAFKYSTLSGVTCFYLPIEKNYLYKMV